MRVTLLESRRRRSRLTWQGVLSAGFHLLVVTGAVQATTSADPEARPPMPDTQLVYVPPVNRARPGPSATLAQPPIEPVAPGLEPGPISFEVPSSIPVGDLRTGFDPEAYRPGTSVDGIRGLVAIDSGAGDVFTTEAVDQPVEIIDQPSPQYPVQLRSLGISGVVLAQFVVDTLGRVEPESWLVLRGSQALFEAAARKSLLTARFSPARIKGRAVRQLVQQSVRFSLR